MLISLSSTCSVYWGGVHLRWKNPSRLVRDSQSKTRTTWPGKKFDSGVHTTRLYIWGEGVGGGSRGWVENTPRLSKEAGSANEKHTALNSRIEEEPSLP